MRNQLPIKLIKKYQANKQIIGTGHCKFSPSCSNYAIEAYTKFNFFYASLLTLWRILRCNPLTKHRYDPVPLTKDERQKLKKQHELEQTYGYDLVSTLISHYYRYPEMQLEDFIKLIFQINEGPGHLINEGDAKAYLLDELKNSKNPNLGKESILTYLGNDYYRFDIRALKRLKISADDLITHVKETADLAFTTPKEERIIQFNQCAKLLSELINAHIITIPTKEMQIKNVPHHSASYVEHYSPHYRLLHLNTIPEVYFQKIITDKIKYLARKNKTIIVAIDGPFTADYSKFISFLKQNFTLNTFCTNDFWLKKPKKAFLNFTQLKREVLNNIGRQKRFSYTPYDYEKMVKAPQVVVENKAINIVYGSGSYSPAIAPYYDYVIYLDQPSTSDTEQAKIVQAYLEKETIKHRADLIVK